MSIFEPSEARRGWRSRRPATKQHRVGGCAAREPQRALSAASLIVMFDRVCDGRGYWKAASTHVLINGRPSLAEQLSSSTRGEFEPVVAARGQVEVVVCSERRRRAPSPTDHTLPSHDHSSPPSPSPCRCSRSVRGRPRSARRRTRPRCRTRTTCPSPRRQLRRLGRRPLPSRRQHPARQLQLPSTRTSLKLGAC
jgi:hypothetical protein